MMRIRLIAVFLIPLILVAFPFLMRPEEAVHEPASETLVIITPNSAQIKYEFEHAFRRHYKAKTGHDISIDWRSPGGSSDIVRYIDDSFTVAFNRYAEDHGIAWDDNVHKTFKNKNLKHGENEIRDLFLDSAIGIGIDLFFGGGTYDQSNFAKIGYAVDAHVKDRHPEYFTDEVIPMTFGGEQLYDENGGYYGYCLASFGIAYNPERIREMNLAPPKNWTDLTSPAYYGTLSLSDPTKSGSITKCYEMIIQQAMQEHGPEKGWAEGFRRIKLMTANARTITDSASKIVSDVSSGEAAAGMCIDFYGLSEAEWTLMTSGKKRLIYQMPQGGSGVSADPIQLLRGAPNRKAAEEFIDFLLSPEGSALWLLKAGVPGGPVKYAQLRPSIRKDLPAKLDPAQMSFPDYRPYEEIGGFVYHGEWTGRYFTLIRVLIKCAVLDPADELRAAWQSILAHGGPEANQDAMNALLELPVPYEKAAEGASALAGSAVEAASTRRIWTENAWQSYRRIREQLDASDDLPASVQGGSRP